MVRIVDIPMLRRTHTHKITWDCSWKNATRTGIFFRCSMVLSVSGLKLRTSPLFAFDERVSCALRNLVSTSKENEEKNLNHIHRILALHFMTYAMTLGGRAMDQKRILEQSFKWVVCLVSKHRMETFMVKLNSELQNFLEKSQIRIQEAKS